MNFLNWRTNEELLQIINDDKADSEIRRKAAAERIQRSGPPCKVPGCYNRSVATWATVSVCQPCKDTLSTEQLNYYAGKLAAEDRTTIYKLALHLPFRPIKCEVEQ